MPDLALTTALDYIDIPPAATLLQDSAASAAAPPSPTNSSTTPTKSSRWRLAPKRTTTLPRSPSFVSTATAPAASESRQRSNSLGLNSPTLSVFPQFLLSAAIPGGLGANSTTTAANPQDAPKKRTAAAVQQPLMSTKDPLTLPNMSISFKRFVYAVGPLFWLQDRIEEIVLWKKGWMVTVVWLSVYGFFCYFPQLVLCLPHIALIGIILSTYPYPHPSLLKEGPASAAPTPAGVAAGTTPDSSEGSIPWQANLQGIQNLMGTFADVMDLVKPYTFHLKLTPAHISPAEWTVPSPLPSPSAVKRQNSSLSTSSSLGTDTTTTTTTPQQRTFDPRTSSPYTVHILILLVLTFPPFAYIVSLPQFPLRFVMFLVGAVPILVLHPWLRNDLFPTFRMLGLLVWNRPIPEPVWGLIREVRRRGRRWMRLVRRSSTGKTDDDQDENENENENENEQVIFGISKHAAVKMIAQRLVDNDQLTDECWASEMREVELWENERYVGTVPPSDAAIHKTRSSSTLSTKPSKGAMTRGKGTWSKSNLRSSERGAWTRRRDGWNGSAAGGGGGGGGGGDDEDGSVDRLTFPLAPGWSFVETEDWRKDVTAEWAVEECGGGDEDGWVYTNDAWQDPQPVPFGRPVEIGGGTDGGDGIGSVGAEAVGMGGPYVTRRRRWVRRIWFDARTACTYGD